MEPTDKLMKHLFKGASMPISPSAELETKQNLNFLVHLVWFHTEYN